MKNLKLFPSKLKRVGWIILIPAVLMGLLSLIFNDSISLGEFEMVVPYYSNFIPFTDQTGFFKLTSFEILPNAAGIFTIIGGVLVGFSKEEKEDEFISSLRLSAVLWSMLVSYVIVLLLFLTVFGFLFLTLMAVALFLPLLLYIARFQFLLYKNRGDEE